MATTDIIFDLKTIDTQLAQDYINKRSEFHSIGFTGNGSYEYDKFNKKIYIADIDAEPFNINSSTSHSDTRDKLLTLAKLIQKNADLFCQLEYLIRGTPLDGAKKCDLKLILNNLFYCCKTKGDHEVYKNIYCDKIAFLADTPLAALGFFAQCLRFSCVNKYNCITIISNKDTAIIGSLFVELCCQAGFENVLLQLVSKDADCSKYNILEIEEMSTGCVGVVTNMCDVDSAVDAFISSNARYPWSAKKIFVQESVLERFKRSLTWKAAGGESEEAQEGMYRCGDKVFSLEEAGAGGGRVVALEAYRTVRELLALLGALRPLAVSLWSSDVAESLEIAHGLDASVVWINDIADFEGPPRVSQAFYSVVDVHFSKQTVRCAPELDEIETLKKSWLRRSTHERVMALMQLIEKRVPSERTVDMNDFQDSFVSVMENVIVTSMITPAGVWQIDFPNSSDDMHVMTFLKEGGGLLVKSLEEHIPPLFQDIIKTKDIPVVREGDSKKQIDHKLVKVLWKPCYKHKVIWTNYGTAFAN